MRIPLGLEPNGHLTCFDFRLSVRYSSNTQVPMSLERNNDLGDISRGGTEQKDTDPPQNKGSNHLIPPQEGWYSI